ncbi:MAG: transposase [Hyphomicrobiaceae bacterium]
MTCFFDRETKIGHKARTHQRRYSKNRYKQGHKIESMFGRIKDWRCIAMRYDRCAYTFFRAICLAATVIFYLKE